ncbi:MAG: response regulator [Lachnospiraceae bacterium]|nr:response regulator [Lachnospiraceae bacterium]
MANISHEIRTPLNTIYGMSEMAQKQTDLNVIKEEIYNIQVASKKLMSMVNDILDFSELQAGEMDLEEEVYNISSTINDVINMTMAAVAEKDLDVVVDFDTSIPALLEGDEKKIRRIIMNMVSNAVKFTHSGYIGIKVSGRRESYGINLSVSITDTGIGMRENYMENLFTGFGQLDTRRNRQEGGVGLGLAISNLLAKKLGGVITVNSKEGKGSVFTFVVPQKIVKDQPVAVLNNPEEISIACYFNVERQARPGSRDAFTAQIENMVKNIPVSWQLCKNLDEMKRRMKGKRYTHVFITDVEYEEDPKYFDAIALRTKLMISVPRNAKIDRKYENALLMYRPVYSLSVVAALNEEYDSEHAEKPIKSKRFSAPSAHVLVVDDNVMNIRVIENILSQFKISVTKALSGSEALEKVESMDFDFIFMDHMMPDMDGVETTHRIREKVGSYYQRVPIIALTANAVAGSRKLFLSEGFSDFLEKPVELSVLERVLRRTLPPEKMIFEDAEDTMKQQETTDSLELTDIDKETGMLYCGGEEGFYMILAECVLNYEENAALLSELFQNKDWENYIIKIHALKSTMKSIGAMHLSDRARELEFAGKEGRFDIILKNHDSVLSEYESLMEQLKKQERVNIILANDSGDVVAVSESTDASEKMSLTMENFDALYAKFEDAMYSLRKDEMLAIVDELSRYKIGKDTKKSELDKIRRKINQDDYFAAGSDLEVLRNDLKGGN